MKENTIGGSDVTCVCFKVWQIRVDVHMLNHDGNLMDAASIAAITALCHFRRPDVGIQGDEVTVVSRQHTWQALPGLLPPPGTSQCGEYKMHILMF